MDGFEEGRETELIAAAAQRPMIRQNLAHLVVINIDVVLLDIRGKEATPDVSVCHQGAAPDRRQHSSSGSCIFWSQNHTNRIS